MAQKVEYPIGSKNGKANPTLYIKSAPREKTIPK